MSVDKPMVLRAVVVTGGRDTIKQSHDRRLHVAIATPGRMADHMENNSQLLLGHWTRLLEGFDAQLATILSSNSTLPADLPLHSNILPLVPQPGLHAGSDVSSDSHHLW